MKPRYTARLTDQQDLLRRFYTWYVVDHDTGEDFFYRCAKKEFWLGTTQLDFEVLGY